MEVEQWQAEFKRLYDKGASLYLSGKTKPMRWFADAEVQFLRGIGCTVQELFDFVEDGIRMGEPDYSTVLRITSLRRDYFLNVQRGRHSPNLVDMRTLPAKSAEYGGVRWLPRITVKAQAKLRGEMPPELMYCCGGDRAFLQEHDLDAADFLKFVWDCEGDPDAVLEYVKGNRPALTPS